MTTNKTIIISSIIIILLLIIVPTSYKIVKNHNKHLYQVVESKIIEVAKKCYYEDKCTNHITLKELYDLNLLEKVSDPVTKEYYNDNSYVEVIDDSFKFIVEK